MRHVVAGTAGHIDHGKSALVRALTGIDPDRLKEEKLRGITIDLGFAHLDLGDVAVGFVDVPGHEKFVKNMLAGVGGIDFVLLVVAADESIMPQTREHFDICRLLGIQSGAVVITKTDLVDPDLVEVVRAEIRDAVAGSFLEGAEIVPVSARTGAGIEPLKDVIRRLALAAPVRSPDRVLRLPIDRAFTIHGFGTVVTGTLTTGQVEKEQEVELLPGGLRARVRGIQVHGAGSDRAIAGQRTAVNLQGVDLSDVARGMVLTRPGWFRATRMFDARVDLLESAPAALQNFVKVRLHHGTAEVLARVALLGRDALRPGESAYAQLRLDAPIFALHGDPFIVRRFSPAVTIGGGRILDPLPAKHKTTDAAAAARLRALDEAPPHEKLAQWVATAPHGAISLGEINARLGLREAKLAEMCGELTRSGALVSIPAPQPILVLPATLESLGRETIEQIERFHAENPLQKGIPREELRMRVFGELPQEVFRFCLDQLVQKRAVKAVDETVALFGREVELGAEREHLRESIEELFQRAGYQPPLLSELPAAVGSPPEEVRRIYFWMLQERILVRIADDMAYHRSTLDDIKDKIRQRFQSGAKFGVAEFKDLFALTRKHAIPLLEFLDRERFTRRQGNERILL
jgi:selenocysteine-specific elongation factor